MASEWPILSLREAGVSLIDCEHRTPPASERGYPYVAIPQVKDGRIHLNGVRRITREHFDEWTRKAYPEPFDVVLSRRCNPGETGFVPRGLQFALGQNLVLLRSDGTKIFKPFLRWLVRGPQWWEQVGMYINVGAVFDSLKCADIPGFGLPVPPLPEQRAIAHILGTLDNKIELNRQMNQTLEEMARALFKSWFVDFDPVHAKATLKYHDTLTPPQGASDWSVERARAYLDRMDPAVAALFPDSFVDSELGPIPEGWEVGTLGDVLCQRVERCRASQETASLPYVPIDCIASKSLLLTESKPGSEAKSSLTKFYTGDLIFGAMRPYYHKVCIAPFDGTTRTTAFVLYLKREHDFAFATFLLFDPNTIDFATRHSTGSTIPYAVWTDSLEAMATIIPTLGVRRAFNDTARGPLARIPQPYFESRTLATLRDALLPKLVSGELRVAVDGNAGEKQTILRGSQKIWRELSASQGSARLS